jgi:Cytochrome P450
VYLETTAHTLAATIGFLSIHEDIQEEVQEQIETVVGYDREPVSPRVSQYAFLSL